LKKFSDFLKERCWPGYKSVPGKKAYSPGSCMKEEDMEEGWSQKYKSSIDCNNPKGFSQKAHCAGKKKNESISEDLRKWFSKTDPAGDWKRINSKGEAIGPCAREPGEPKPKCMSKAKRASLSKKERASAVAAKRKHDPNPERQGKPINVSNFGKGKISEDMQAKAQAKAKFDVYPSAYANGWAAKKYKAMGGSWKSVSEETEIDEGAVPAKEKTVTVRHKTSGKELVVTAEKAKQLKQQDYHPIKEAIKDKFDIGEYDQEGDMAKSDLRSIMANAKRVHDMLEDSDNLPEWVQSKITKAEDYMSTVANYMAAEMSEEVKQIDEITQSDLDKSAEQEVAHAKKNGWKVQKRTYGRTYTHPKHGHIDMDRYGEWQHRPQSGISRGKGNLIAHGEFKDLDKHISSLKEEVKQIDELSNKTLYSYLRKTGGVKSSTEVHPRNTSNVPHDLQYQAQDSAKSRINARKGHGSVAPKGYAKEEVQMEDAVGLAKPKTGLTAAAKTLAPATRVAEASKPPFDKPYTTIKGTVTDKSGAKHTPMSRARDIARMAMKKQIEKMKQPVKESLDESRRMEIVREAMKVAKKKKETMAADDKYQSDPVLSSQINKT